MMYEVSGYPPVSQREYERYLSNRKAAKDIEARAALLEDTLVDFDSRFTKASRTEKVALARDGLRSGNIDIQRYIAGGISSAPTESRLELLLLAVEIDDGSVQKWCSFAIRNLPDESKEVGIRACFATGKSEVQMQAAMYIDSLLPEKRAEIEGELRAILDEGISKSRAADLYNYISASRSLSQESEKKNVYTQAYHVIEDGITSKDTENAKHYVQALMALPIEQQRYLAKLYLEQVEKSFETDAPEVQLTYAEVLPLLHEFRDTNVRKDKLPALIERGLALENVEYARTYARMIKSAHRDDIPRLSLQCLKHKDSEIQYVGASHADQIQESDLVAFVEAGLATENVEVQKMVLKVLSKCSPEDTKRLFTLAVEKLGNALVEPPLYKKSTVNPEVFSREAFSKTGSGMTLLGGDLVNKSIVRHISAKAFVAWEKLYEDYESWKKAGFDYVPIEPIQSFRMNKDGGVDVFSGVLDLSFKAWYKMGGGFFKELSEESGRILNQLTALGVRHNHAHADNFCLRFWRDKDGKVDFTRKPRIYLIDFDESTSS